MTSALLGLFDSAANVTGSNSAFASAAGSRHLLAILVAPLKDLVRVHSVLACHSRNRCSRHQRSLHDPPLLLRRSPLPLHHRLNCSALNVSLTTTASAQC